MAAGQIGESGIVAVSPVAGVFKYACELARDLLRVVVVLIVRGITYNLKFAILMDAQVRVS